MLKTEIELENKDIAATKFHSLVSKDSPALLRPLPLSRRRGDTRLHHPHPPGYEGQPLREREREREQVFWAFLLVTRTKEEEEEKKEQ